MLIKISLTGFYALKKISDISCETDFSDVRATKPITYKIKDLKGEDIKGTFYDQELQKTKQEIYRIEKY